VSEAERGRKRNEEMSLRKKSREFEGSIQKRGPKQRRRKRRARGTKAVCDYFWPGSKNGRINTLSLCDRELRGGKVHLKQ
jgi:hypothetical protein